MLAAQAMYGPDDQAFRGLENGAFGRALYRLVPEDRFDVGPLVCESGRILFVADARLDNRGDLAGALGLSSQAVARMSDAQLLFAGFERWREDVLDRLAGDFAFAAWLEQERKLVLARDPLGQRPLCYHEGGDNFAFASMPGGIHALGVRSSADEQRIAEYMADLVFPNGRSFHDGISVVKPGEVLTLQGGEARSRRYWSPSRATLRLNSMADYIEAYREKLDVAVQSRLRGSDGRVGTHLSSGYDSSAVSATAARLLQPASGRVVAFTSAPRAGFEDPGIRGRIGDESGVAAITASLHPNMEHVVIRPSGISPLDLMVELMRLAQQPIAHIPNAPWWTAINEEASRRGLKIMLTGQMGNLSISAGGLFQLADLVRTGEWASWSREAYAAIKGREVNWRGVLANSFGPWLPKPVWKLITGIFLHTSHRAGTPFLLTPKWKGEIRSLVDRLGRDPRPPKDDFALRVRLLQWQDSGQSRKMMLARYGVDERDPTADQRLIRFCLSLPIELLLKDGVRRPLARAALADRLPPEVLDARLRGYQSADWHEQISKAAARASLAAVEGSDAAGRVIDLQALEALIESWPTAGWEKLSVGYEYGTAALHALAAAHFAKIAAEQPAECQA